TRKTKHDRIRRSVIEGRGGAVRSGGLMAKNREAVKRALQMASMTAGVTGSYLGYFAQRIFLDENARQRALKQTHAKAGRRMTARMAKLRRPAMKLGQTLSLQAGLLPDEALAELTSLQMSAHLCMHLSCVRCSAPNFLANQSRCSSSSR